MSTIFARILVPLDSSPRAERALTVAGRLARRAGGTVILGSVVSPMSVFAAPMDVPRSLESYIDDEVAGATEYLRRVSLREELAGVRTEIATAVGTPVASELAQLAAAQHADAIVLCSHGRSGIARWALGSVAQHLIRTSRIPVLVLKADGPSLSHARADQESVRVLVPLDGSPLAETATEPAARLAAALAPGNAIVHLLHVIEYPAVVYPAFIPAGLPSSGLSHSRQLREKAEAYLQAMTQRMINGPLSTLPVRVTQSVIVHEDAASAIASAANGKADERIGSRVDDTLVGIERLGEVPYSGADIIAMATHGRMGLARVAMGSVTERVLESTRRPLFVVRPDPAAVQGKPALDQMLEPHAGQDRLPPLF